MIGLISILAIVLLGLILAFIFTGPLQDYFIFRPRKLHSDFKFSFVGSWEERWLQLEDGANLNGVIFRSEGHSNGLVFYCHGNSGNIVTWEPAVRFFLERGWDVFLWDYRGFGKSTGPRSQKAMYADAMHWYRHWLNSYPQERILLFGRSLGSTIAIELAANVNASHLILETAFSSMEDLFYSYYPFAPRIFRFKYVFPSRSYLPRVACHITFFHGTRDTVIPLRNAKKLRNSLKGTDQFIVLSGANHGDCGRFQRYVELMDKILKKNSGNSNCDSGRLSK